MHGTLRDIMAFFTGTHATAELPSIPEASHLRRLICYFNLTDKQIRETRKKFITMNNYIAKKTRSSDEFQVS